MIELVGMDWKTILFQYSMRITGNRWDAEDLAQDAWLKLAEAVRSRPERPVTKAFVYRIARNAWIDVQRKQKIRSLPFHPSHESAAADGLLSSRELLEQLAERLPPKMAVILLLMDVFDFTAGETAEYIRMKEAAVQVALGRARLRLKRLAKEPSAVPLSAASKEVPADFDALVAAFQRRDPDAIFRAYMGLAHSDIRLSRLQSMGGLLRFTFQDPDGNLFSVVQAKGHGIE